MRIAVGWYGSEKPGLAKVTMMGRGSPTPYKESDMTKQDYCVLCDRLTLHIETEGDGWVHHGGWGCSGLGGLLTYNVAAYCNAQFRYGGRSGGSSRGGNPTAYHIGISLSNLTW